MNKEKILKKGINTITIEKLQYATNNYIKNKEKELLKPLVNDTELLNILVQEENMKKLQGRIIYEITYEGTPKDNLTKNNETLAKASTGAKTITTLQNEINNAIYENGNEIGSGTKLTNALNNKDQHVTEHKKGYVKNIKITTKLIQPK